MDSLTQIVLGAACGEAVLGKKVGNKALLWGAIAGTIPDLDVFISPFVDPVTALFTHRGFSHSIFFAFLVAPVLGYIISKIHSKSEATLFQWTTLSFWALFTHPLLDALTGYGTSLFLPLSTYRIEVNSIFIVDPLYTLPFLICVLVVSFCKRANTRDLWNTFGLTFSTLYLAFTLLNKMYIGSVFIKSLKNQQIEYSRFMTYPTPFNNFLWSMIAESADGYWVGYYSWFDKNKEIEFSFFPRNAHLIDQYIEQKDIKKIIRFSKGYYCIREIKDTIYFNDIRFGQIGGWANKKADFVFSYKVTRQNDGSVKITKGAWRNARMKAMDNLLDRIKGI